MVQKGIRQLNMNKNMQFDYSTYLSPFTFRYGSEKMRYIWSEYYKRLLWRKIWVAIATVQNEAGLVSKKELQDIITHQENIDIDRAGEIEKEIKHDVMAEVKTYASQCKTGGGKIHLGATSMDITDNADILRVKESLDIVRRLIKEGIERWLSLINQYQNLVCMGYTHLQPAEPTTLGYRFCLYAYDLFCDLVQIDTFSLKSKGIKGAVGTSASYVKLLENTKMSATQFEKKVMEKIGLDFVPVSSQTYPRKTDYQVLNHLSGVAQSAHKFAFDLRILQSPLFGELSEGFGKKQVGSSAMPFKKNPITSEKICSLSRYVSNMTHVAWENAANSLLERTLDDSANRRIVLAEAFLAIEEILLSYNRILKNLVVNQTRIKHNLKQYGIFSVSETILMETVKNGADRQTMHELLRQLSLQAWDKLVKGEDNPLENLLRNNKTINKYLKEKQIANLLIEKHIGNAKEKCQKMIKIFKDL